MADQGKALGVAMSKPELEGLTVTDEASIGASAAALVAFHGATPCDQSDTAAAVSASAAVAVSGTAVYGFNTQAQADALVTLANALRVCAREKGLMA